MFDRVKLAIFTLLRTVLGINCKMSDSTAGILPFVPENILVYNMRMQNLKMLEGLALQQQWRVTCLRAYKCRASSRHEYLSATVVDSNDKTRTSHVTVERQRGDPIHVVDTNIVIVPDPAPSNLFSVSNTSISSFPSTSSNSDPFANYDMIAPVSASGKKNSSDDLIYELNFGEKPLYLYQLTVLAVLIHKNNTRYLLIDNNCYHFAGTIVKVLEQHYNIANSVDGSGGRWWCGLVLFPGKSGGHNSSILERFKEEIKKFVSLQF